jgi:preprotein translocase subunit YajC
MSFFISDAMAEGAGAAGQSDPLLGLLFPIGMIAILYFFMIRPQMKRQKEHRTLVADLSKGDEIVSSGGIAGKITAIGENFVKVEIADGIEVKVRRQAVESILPKGSLKEL